MFGEVGWLLCLCCKWFLKLQTLYATKCRFLTVIVKRPEQLSHLGIQHEWGMGSGESGS